MDEAKEDMIDVVKFLQNPEAFNHVGAKIPKGKVEVKVIELPQIESQCHTGRYCQGHYKNYMYQSHTGR